MGATISRAAADRRRPVQETAAKLRELVLGRAPAERLGALPELAKTLGVGIVTIQQAARILEHEGLLDVRRGPGGGYYGRRPDAAALERLIAAYMRLSPASYDEALDMTSLLFTELAAAAALCRNEALHAELRAMAARIAQSDSGMAIVDFESAFQNLLFRMVERPLFEVLTRVTLSVAGSRQTVIVADHSETQSWWVESRQRIIAAILQRDVALARFEAERGNRRPVMRYVQSLRAARAAEAKP
jgi:DNA-binding FadR family transcriptional regulator